MGTMVFRWLWYELKLDETLVGKLMWLEWKNLQAEKCLDLITFMLTQIFQVRAASAKLGLSWM